MTTAWKSETPWSHHGTYWKFDDVVVEPPSAQQPHPPLWMGAGSPSSVNQVAALGFNLLLGQFDSFETITELISIFKAEVEARGRVFDPMTAAVARSVNIVDSAAAVRTSAGDPHRRAAPDPGLGQPAKLSRYPGSSRGRDPLWIAG